MVRNSFRKSGFQSMGWALEGESGSARFASILLTSAVIALPAGAHRAMGQCAPSQIVKVDNLGGANDWFGNKVAIQGDTAIVGAWLDDVGGVVDAGSAYVLVQSNTTWAWQATLSPAGATNFRRFGQAVDVFGDTVAVATQQGSVYVFTRSGSSWTEQANLTAPDSGTGGGGGFGISVAVDGDTLAVGAHADGNTEGAVYIFVRSGGIWTFQQKLIASDPEIVALMGISVDLEGDTLIAGAPGALSAFGTTGAAYVFTRVGTVWAEEQKLVPTSATDDFGTDVAISGETVVVGAPADNQAGGGAGAAFFYDRSGTTWTFQVKRMPNEVLVSGDNYGQSVALYGDTAIIGAYRDEMNDWGSVWLLTRQGGAWSLGLKISAADPGNQAEFGISVGLEQDVAVVGAPLADALSSTNHGSAYFYDIRCDGACCVNGFCTRMSLGDCNAVGGVFQGLATNCTGVMCAPQDCCPGDMNGDLILNGLDVQPFVTLMLQGGVCP